MFSPVRETKSGCAEEAGRSAVLKKMRSSFTFLECGLWVVAWDLGGCHLRRMVGHWEQGLGSSISAAVPRGERSQEGRTFIDRGLELPRLDRAPGDRGRGVGIHSW